MRGKSAIDELRDAGPPEYEHDTRLGHPRLLPLLHRAVLELDSRLALLEDRVTDLEHTRIA